MSDLNRDRLAEMFSEMDWATIDDLYNSALKAGVFSPSHFAKCIVMHSKSALRRILKSGKLKQADGATIKLASIVMPIEGTTKKARVYKREDLFTPTDSWQVIAYWERYEKYGRKKKQYYKKHAVQLHGKNFTKLFPCFKEEVPA